MRFWAPAPFVECFMWILVGYAALVAGVLVFAAWIGRKVDKGEI